MIIAHVTDSHIKPPGRLAYRKIDTAAALEACVSHVNSLVPRPDVMLFSGDMTDAGLDAEYQQLRELLTPLKMPVYMVPGNHDEREALRRAFPNHQHLHTDDTFVQYVVEDWPVRLIGLDTTVPGRDEGMVCDRRLAWLAERLAESPRYPTLLFMHHPPFQTGIAHMDVQKCGNAEQLGELLARHPQVIGLLSGHVHRAIQANWYGIPASIGPSPSHAVVFDLCPDGPPYFTVEPPACQILFWDNRTLIRHLSYIGQYDGPYPFFDSDGRLID